MWVLRALVLAMVVGAAALSVSGCGDDDYNGDAAAAGNEDLSASVDLFGTDFSKVITDGAVTD
jgi:hypothetical protein